MNTENEQKAPQSEPPKIQSDGPGEHLPLSPPPEERNPDHKYDDGHRATITIL